MTGAGRWCAVTLGMVCAAGAALPAWGQTAPNRIRNLSTRDGLSHDVVYAVLRDRQGFMWFGTEDGLDRYDGYSFEHFHNRQGAKYRSSSGNVSHLLEDSDGAIWVATWGGGLNRFDPDTETFEHFLHDPEDPDSLAANRVQRLWQDRSGQLWVGTYDGLDRLRRDGERVLFDHFRHDPDDPSSLSASRIWSISEGPDGDLWLGTHAGLDRFDPGTGRIERFRHRADDEGSLGHDLVRVLYHDSQGTLWVGTETGLDRFDESSGTFAHVSLRGAGETEELDSGTINTIVESRDGALWVGTQHGGISRLDREGGRFVHLSYSPVAPNRVSHEDVRALLEDETGLLWVGTRGGGVDVLDLRPPRFSRTLERPDVPPFLRRRLVSTVVEDGRGELWVGTDRGLVGLSADRRSVTVYRHDPADARSLIDDAVKVLHEDRSGRLWVGTQGGLESLGPAREAFEHHVQPAGSRRDRERIEALLEDSQGTLWIGTQGGLARFDRETGSFMFSTLEGTDGAFVWSVFEDREGRLWVGTEFDGLYRFDPARDRFERFRSELSARDRPGRHRVTAIDQGKSGALWLATGDGLSRLDPDSGELQSWHEEDGLPSANLKCVLGDGLGNLWVSSNRGLSRVRLDSMAIRTFDVNDGLQGLVFAPGVCYRAASGRMHFGGLYGLNSFEPASIRESEGRSPLVLSSFLVHERSVDIETALAAAGEIELDHEDNTLAFEFAALDYRSPELVRYAYRLDGFDSEWVESGHRRYAGYTNVPPGAYVFRVKATDSEGVWREAGWSVRFHIVPPFWQRWWFRSMVVLVPIVVAVAWHRMRLRSVRRQSRRLERMVAQRTAEVRSEKRKLEVVNSIVKLINAESDFRDLLAVILEGVTFTERADNALAFILDRGSGRFEVEASFGWTRGLPDQPVLERDEIESGYLGAARLVGDGLWIGPPADSVLLAEQRRLGCEPRALLALRIEIDGEVAGYLLFGKLHDEEAFASLEIGELLNLKEHVESAFRKGRMLEELRELNRRKNEFLGIAAHDLRSPLGGVISYTDLLLRLLDEPPIDADRWRRFLGNVKLTASQMLQLINNLLDVTAIESGRLELQLEPTRLPDLVAERSALHRRSADDKGIELAMDLERNEVEVEVDRVHIGEVLDNLLSNAIKFTAEGGRVRLSVETLDRELHVHVEDSGQGLESHEVGEVFSGKKLSARPTGGESSTGLGLVIVKKIVGQHGGRVWATSRKGEGSTFSFSLPRGRLSARDA